MSHVINSLQIIVKELKTVYETCKIEGRISNKSDSLMCNLSSQLDEIAVSLSDDAQSPEVLALIGKSYEIILKINRGKNFSK